MEDGDSQRIETFIDQARALSPDQRAQMLDEAYDGDSTLRPAVETPVGREREELSAELIDSIALEAVASTSRHAFDDTQSKPSVIAVGEGRPYFVMDSVDGLPIDQYCDSRRLGITARLQLFRRVCEALHFAHQHALIHRDLKPSNILVTADGLPNIVDFGIARRIDPDPQGKPMLTPEYTSPEQINGEPATTACDIYAMGVVLYRLLAGRWPYRVGSQPSTADLLQAVCEQVPERPSIAIFRIDARGDSPTETSMARSTAPYQLKRILAGDLDAIVLMALSKEPEGRYASADQFAEDLKRYRQGLPVRARRNSMVDRASKFARRNVAATTAILLTLIAVIGGAGAISRELIRTRRDHDRTAQVLNKTRQMADQLFNKLREDRQLNQTGLQPLRQTLLATLKPIYEDVLNQLGHNPLVGPKMAEGTLTLARINDMTGSSSQSLSQYQQAIALWETLVANNPVERAYPLQLAETCNEFGEALMSSDGRLDEALAAFRNAQTLMESIVATDPESVSTHHKLALILTNIAQIQQKQGQLDDAGQLLDRVVEIESKLAETDPESVDFRIALAGAFSAMGRLFFEQPDEPVRAMGAYYQAIEVLDSLTREHPEFADQSEQLALDLVNLSSLQKKTGQSELALASLRRSLKIIERLDQLYPGVLSYQVSLARNYNLLGDHQREQGEITQGAYVAHNAQTLFEQLVAEYPKNPSFALELARSHNIIGRLLERGGNRAEALRSLTRAIDQLDSLVNLDPKNNYNLACNIALCISLIDGKETKKTDQLRKQIYFDRAITALRRAMKGGCLNADMLQSNTDLDSIRDRLEFRSYERRGRTTGDSRKVGNT